MANVPLIGQRSIRAESFADIGVFVTLGVWKDSTECGWLSITKERVRLKREPARELVVAADAFLSSTLDGRRLVIAPAGEWTAKRAGEIEPLVDAVVRERPQVERVEIDARGLQRLDTVGAWLMERLRRSWADAGINTQIVSLEPRYQVLISEVAHSNLKEFEHHRPIPPMRDALEHVGKGVADSVDDFEAIVRVLGNVMVAAGRIIIHPSHFRFTSIVHHLDTVGYRAVPIIVLINFLIAPMLASEG